MNKKLQVFETAILPQLKEVLGDDVQFFPEKSFCRIFAMVGGKRRPSIDFYPVGELILNHTTKKWMRENCLNFLLESFIPGKLTEIKIEGTVVLPIGKSRKEFLQMLDSWMLEKGAQLHLSD